jgi:FkbM family methyltransferase
MLERVPDPIREPLWHVKHSVVRWLQAHSFAEAVDAWLEKQLRELRIDTVLDVGANRGQFGRLLRRVGSRGRIVSFEPVADNFAALRRRAAGDRNWTVLPIALGDADGSVEINVTAGDVFCSMLEPSAACHSLFGQSGRVMRRETVQVRRLDAVLPEVVPSAYRDRVHLKLDTQGYDLNALKGAGELLRTLPSVQTELSLVPIYERQPGYVEVLQFLKSVGLEPTGFFPVTRDPGTLRVIEYDAFFGRG